MLMKDILPALALPAAAVKDTSIPQRDLLANGVRHPGDKRTILREIASIRWLAAINLSTAQVLPHVNSEREYLEMGILSVSLAPRAQLVTVAEAIHALVPYPVAIFFGRDDKVIEISLAHKERSSEARGRPVIDGALNHCGLGDSAQDAAFFRSLSWPVLPQNDLFIVYYSWMERLDALKASRLTNEFSLCTTAALVERRHGILAEYVRQFQHRKALRRKLQDAYYPGERESAEAGIERANAAIETHRESLRQITKMAADLPRPNIPTPESPPLPTFDFSHVAPPFVDRSNASPAS